MESKGGPGEVLEGPVGLEGLGTTPPSHAGSLGLLAIPLAFRWIPWQSIKLPLQLFRFSFVGSSEI